MDQKNQSEMAGRLRSKGLGVTQSNLFEVKTLTSDWSNIGLAKWASIYSNLSFNT